MVHDTLEKYNIEYCTHNWLKNIKQFLKLPILHVTTSIVVPSQQQ